MQNACLQIDVSRSEIQKNRYPTFQTFQKDPEVENTNNVLVHWSDVLTSYYSYIPNWLIAWVTGKWKCKSYNIHNPHVHLTYIYIYRREWNMPSND